MLKIHQNAFGKVDGGGGLLWVGVLLSGVEPEGFVVNHGQGQRHLFGFQVRPDDRGRWVFGWGSCWKQGGDSLLDDAAARFGRRWRKGVNALSEGSGCRGSSVLRGPCCLLMFGFC